MLPAINLSSNRSFSIRNFDEDKNVTLNAHKGLRYEGKFNDYHKFSGNYYLTNFQGDLIESYQIFILISKSYPNVFPIVYCMDEKIEKIDDFHINKEGMICVEHTYVANNLASAGLRIYDFINYYLPKYFSWVLLKQNNITDNIQEWAHQEKGNIQFYETLLGTTDKNMICLFLEGYCKAKKIKRNDKCYCGNDKKVKYCHLEAAQYLKSTSKQIISNDIALFH